MIFNVWQEARKILSLAQKGLSMADKVQRGLASQYPEIQSGGVLMGGGRRRRCARKRNLSGLNAYEIRELPRLMNSYHIQTKGGNRRSR